MQNALVIDSSGFISAKFVRIALNSTPNCRITNLGKLFYEGNPPNLADTDTAQYYRFDQGNICHRELIDSILEEEIDSVVRFFTESHVDRNISGVFLPVSATHLRGKELSVYGNGKNISDLLVMLTSAT